MFPAADGLLGIPAPELRLNPFCANAARIPTWSVRNFEIFPDLPEEIRVCLTSGQRRSLFRRLLGPCS